jgi:chromosome partitioning protein
MTVIYAISNQKGGVGKTTTCINLAAALVKTGLRVLLIDSDPQGNATMGSGVNKNQLTASLTDVLLGQCEAGAAIQPSASGFDVLPANSDLTFAEIQLLQLPEREQQLTKALATITANYDVMLIDCPPSLNTLTLNALVAANGVIIPMQCEYFSLEGLTSLLSTLQQIRENINPSLHVSGILRTMFDKRSRLCADVSKQLLRHFADDVFSTYIPRNIRLAEAPSHGLATLDYDAKSLGAIAYERLAEELLNRQKRHIKHAQTAEV